MKTVLLHDQPLSGNGNHGTGAKRFGRGRIAGLILIALLTLGLGYLHFAGGSKSGLGAVGRARGPADAEALHLRENEPADCGTLVVPENRHDPHSRLIALPITRIRAHSSAHPGAPIFRLQGGPGITNMDFPDAKRFTAHHDVVLVGYRGVDGSSRLDCPEVSRVDGSTRATCSASGRSQPTPSAYRACAKRLQRQRRRSRRATRCPSASTTSSSHATASATDQIDLVSESAGTRTAMIYAWRYPQSIHRSVMIGVNPPGNFLWNAKTTGEQIRRYAALCAQAQELPQPDARPRRVDPLRLRQVPEPLLVPADQEGQRPRRRLLRPHQRDLRRRRPARRAADDRHAPLRSTRATAPRVRGCSRSSPQLVVPARAGLGRRRRRSAASTPTYGRRLFATRRRPWLADRHPRHRPPLGRRPPARRLAGEPRRERIHPASKTRTSRRC